MRYVSVFFINVRPILPYLAAFLLLWFLSGCASDPRPYVPVGSQLGGGQVYFHRWASRGL